ncbi:MAG: hypothetical protein H8D45_30940 [Bacteroidetes bacterium]|nr:hypothetical protein [Bacteroidota bacterium]
MNLKRSIKGWWTVLVIFLISILMQGCDKKPDYIHIVVDRMLRSEEIPFVVRGVWQRKRDKWLYYAEPKKDCYVQVWLLPRMYVPGDTVRFEDLLL